MKTIGNNFVIKNVYLCVYVMYGFVLVDEVNKILFYVRDCLFKCL